VDRWNAIFGFQRVKFGKQCSWIHDIAKSEVPMEKGALKSQPCERIENSEYQVSRIAGTSYSTLRPLKSR
jgi:hypothetical protein